MQTVGPSHEAGALWSSALEALANRVSTRRRIALTSGTHCLGLEDASLRVTAHTSDLGSWVRAGIIRLLEQALETVGDGSLSLAVVPIDDGEPLERDP